MEDCTVSTIEQSLHDLPTHLSERTRLVGHAEHNDQGEFVMYWMSNAVRADENPALDVAKFLATRAGLPLLVYQGLSQNYEYASDRHHTFIMQGARDVQRTLTGQGISYAFHLERPGNEGKHLKTLASRAAIVVAEDMPTGPQPVFLRTLAKTARATLVSVDTACVVPMRLVGRAYERAFQFRSKTEKLFAERVERTWPKSNECPEPLARGWLPFEPLDLQDADIAELVAQCKIDHTVGPVLDTIGGSLAGYARWEEFLNGRLKNYAKQRNDALRDGVSRMSAYLHYGMVSPLRLAREAASRKCGGAEKYLDELLIWRELAYCFCFYRADHADWNALPSWAQASLQAHASDARQYVYAWEDLARGQTHDELWNAAQKSLLIHGELHNNVRMTWGKAILKWKRTPQEALETVIDLNHRYALDGRDPSSYGGILWCFGQFDRPFQPEQPILGTVRGRPTAIHAQRLDTLRYAAKTSVSRCASVPSVAVVGAGLSGAMAARTLADHGLPVTVFEKSRGAGGRMATRRTNFGDFDHGAQYFTARDERFKRYVASWIEQGVVAGWKGRIAVYDCEGEYGESSSDGRFVGMPGMSSVAKHVVRDLDMRTLTRVKHIRRQAARFELLDEHEESLGVFDRVIVTAPAPQTTELVRPFDDLASAIQNITLNPCWAVMFQLVDQLPIEWAGAFVNLGPLRWISRNSSKPDRDHGAENIVVHASPEWSSARVEMGSDQVCSELLAAFWRVLGLEPQPVVQAESHRWLYSIPAQVAPESCFSNAEETVFACGDWAGGPRVEGAFLSGCAAAGRVLGTLAGKKQGSGINTAI